VADDDDQLDPAKPNHVTIVGRKGSGKSVLAQLFWDSYPFDRLVVDPTGDVDTRDPNTIALHTPLPHRWPAPNPLKDERQTLRFVPDMGAATYVQDMDHAVGLAFNHGGEHKRGPHRRALLWVDEVGELTDANRTPPAMRRVLHQSRHRGLSTLFCGPRPIDINKLVITQADYIGVFPLPDFDDRRRLAKVMGYDLEDFEAAHRDLLDRGPHWYLWYIARSGELELRPPIPHRPGPPRPDPRGYEPTVLNP
jgi:hypothetical protein